MSTETNPTTGVMLDPEKAKWMDELFAQTQKEKQQAALVEKGLKGELGISAHQFKELYDNGNLQHTIKSYGFNEQNAGLVVELAITAYQKQMAEAAQKHTGEMQKKEEMASSANYQQQSATGGHVGANATGHKQSDPKDIVDHRNVDYSRLDKVTDNRKFTHSIVSNWYK